jgi:hypothetical protein
MGVCVKGWRSLHSPTPSLAPGSACACEHLGGGKSEGKPNGLDTTMRNTCCANRHMGVSFRNHTPVGFFDENFDENFGETLLKPIKTAGSAWGSVVSHSEPGGSQLYGRFVTCLEICAPNFRSKYLQVGLSDEIKSFGGWRERSKSSRPTNRFWVCPQQSCQSSSVRRHQT